MTMKTDKRLHREMSSLENSIRNGDQLTLSNPNFLVNPTSAPPFLKELVYLKKHTNKHPPSHKNKLTQN